MASTDGKDKSERNQANKEIENPTKKTLKASAGMAMAKLGVVLNKLLEFMKAHCNAHVVFKNGVREAHALLRVFQLSQKTPGNLPNTVASVSPHSGRRAARPIRCCSHPKSSRFHCRSRRLRKSLSRSNNNSRWQTRRTRRTKTSHTS